MLLSPLVVLSLMRIGLSNAFIHAFKHLAWSESFPSPAPFCLQDNSISVLFDNLACSRNPTTDLVLEFGQRETSKALTNHSANPVIIPQATPDAPGFPPWSFKPVCTEVFRSINSELCVYTNTTFNRGRGISIFTTPRLAAEIAKLPAFQDPALLPEDFQWPWYTEELPGRGIGVVADRELHRGDLVTAYTPLLLAYRGLEKELSTPEREQFMRTAIAQLPPESQKQYLDLVTLWGAPEIMIQDVIMANAYYMEVGGEEHDAVYPETSRINHACAPNSQFYQDSSKLAHIVHATRSISPGEEITVTYIPPFSFNAQRSDQLQEHFHFKCSCSRCAANDSDAALTEMAELQAILSDYTPQTKATPAKAERLIQIYQEQGLDGFLEDAYGYAAVAYNGIGDYERAKNFTRLAIEALHLQSGHDAWTLKHYNELLADPMGHWSWRYLSSKYMK